MNSDHPHLHSFTREQKLGFFLLLFFGVLTVGLGFLQIRNTIYNPFAFEPKETSEEIAALETDPTIRLQNIDTDQDGLSDYDELNFYGTSPYLPDTDSDGINDKDEIDAGTDPNCSEGKPCSSPEGNSNPLSTIESSPLLDSGANPLDSLGQLSTTIGATTTLGVEALLKDPSSLRSVLITSGKMTASDLANVTDEQLIALFTDIVEKQSVKVLHQQTETGINGTGDTNISTTTNQ